MKTAPYAMGYSNCKHCQMKEPDSIWVRVREMRLQAD